MKLFDQKFGIKWIAAVPTAPGIYRVYNAGNQLIYIGKAKNLRRRLAQYRNASRIKAHEKMRMIVRQANRIEYESLLSERDAHLRETELIQQHRPLWNVAGAFYFLYPFLGISFADDTLSLVYTSDPGSLAEAQKNLGLEWHGSFRSKGSVKRAFFGLRALLRHLGPVSKNLSRQKYTYHFEYRNLPPDIFQKLSRLLKGDSPAFLAWLSLELLEAGSARRSSDVVQEHLRNLQRFWRFEVRPLTKVRKDICPDIYPVPQRERDLIFLKHHYQKQANQKEDSPDAIPPT